MATQPAAAAGGPRRLMLVAALAGVLVLIVFLLVVRPLLGGETEEELPAPPAVTAGAAPATPTTRGTGPSTSSAPTGEAGGSVKDPFRPLVGAGSGAAATESGVTAGPGGAPATTVPTQSTVPGAGAGAAPTPGGGATTERKVTLLGISGSSAKVSVDGTAYTVEEGESFADGYRAVDIGSECATFESGTTPFTLCEGEAVLK
jgi:hypothetical protein